MHEFGVKITLLLSFFNADIQICSNRVNYYTLGSIRVSNLGRKKYIQAVLSHNLTVDVVQEKDMYNAVM